MLRRLSSRPSGELLAYLALMAAGLAVRLIDLGSRTFHHDESQDAYFSWVFFEDGDYAYDPLLHGPVRFYLTALMYLLFGDSDFTARLAPALMGTAIIGLPYLLRRQIGSIAALAAAAAFAFGPTYLYFSRFAREDIYIAAVNLALLAAVFRLLDRPRTASPSIVLGLTAVAFATKETTYITLFVAGTFLIPAAVLRPEVRAALAAPGRVGWAYGAATFALIFTVLFTVFLTNPPGLWDGLHDALAYWLGQQDVGRGGEPWWFYVAVLVAEEWPMLLLGAVGAVAVARRPTLIGLFLIWAFLLSLAVYSWASEKFAWLVMHPLMPLVLLAGIGVQALWSARRTAVRIAGGAAVIAGAAYLGHASFLVNARNHTDPREWLVSTQSAPAVKRVVERVRALGPDVTVTVDESEGATFPYAWYFRHLEAGYIDMRRDGFQPEAEVLIMTEASRVALEARLGAYDAGERFPFRVWWVRDRSRVLDAGAWWDWYTERRPWNPTGGMHEWIHVRREAQPPPSTGGAGSSEPGSG